MAQPETREPFTFLSTKWKIPRSILVINSGLCQAFSSISLSPLPSPRRRSTFSASGFLHPARLCEECGILPARVSTCLAGPSRWLEARWTKLKQYYQSSSKLRKFRKFTYIMNPSYSRPVSLDPLFSQPVSLCVICFTPVNWLVAVGRPFSSIWKLFGTMSMPCVVPEMLWSLDELKHALIGEFPILETEVGEGFKILCDLFVEWAEIPFNYNNQHPLCCWIWGIVAQNPSLRGFPAAHTHVASHSRGVIGLQRTPSHSTYTHRSSYSTKGIVYQKNRRIQPIFFFNEPEEVFFIFFSRRR